MAELIEMEDALEKQLGRIRSALAVLRHIGPGEPVITDQIYEDAVTRAYRIMMVDLVGLSDVG